MAISSVNTDWRTGTNGATTTLTDFTAKTRSFDGSIEKAMEEATVFGNSSRQYEVGLEDGTFSVTYKYDDTIWGQMTAIYNNGDLVDFQVSPNGTTSTNPRVTGSAYISSLSLPAEVGSLQEFTVEYQQSAGFTFDTHP